MEQRHLVQKYIFDVEFDSESKAFQFQNQLAAYIKEKLVNLTDEVFSEVSDKHNVGINKLVINLGDISFDNFEEQLYSRLKSHLSDKLRLLISGTGINLQEEQVEFISKDRSDLKIFEYFLSNGTLPWSVRRSDPEFSIQQTVIRSLDEQPSEVKKIIVSGITKEEVRLRIIRQLEDVVLWKIIRIWAGTETEKIRKFYSDLINLYTKRPIVKNYFSEFREMVWEFILTEVVVLNKFKPAVSEFTVNFFDFVSSEVQMSFVNTIKLFYTAIVEEASALKSSIPIGTTGGIAIDYQTELPKVIADLSRKHKVSLSETEGEPLRSKVGLPGVGLEREKQDRKRIEKYRQEQIKKRQEFLIKFLNAYSFITDRDDFKSQTKKAEIIIRELITTHPAFVKKAFYDVKFEINVAASLQMLELFQEDVLEVVLKEIFQIEKKEFFSMKEESASKIVGDFLKTGYFPHSSLPLFFRKVDFQRMIGQVFESSKSDEFLKFVKKTITTGRDKSFRISQLQKYFNVTFLKKYFSEVYSKQTIEEKSFRKKNTDDLSYGKAQLIKLSDLNTADRIIYVIQYLLSEKSLPVKADYTASQVIDKFFLEHKTVASAYLSSLKEKEFDVIKKAVSPVIAKKIVEQKEALRKAVKEVTQTEIQEEIKIPEEIREEQDKKPFRKLESGEPVYINNAGLVIFHPYLSRFFKMFDLLDGRVFKDELSAHKAAHLLQYLVNKSLSSEEHDLVLNKLLCGIDLQTPLIRDIEITEEEKNICEGLIEGVIKNWAVLKKTSNDNFRSSFVLREGRLLQENKDWRLKIEERGYDILVEKLPWSVSMIKLPWMNHMIYVEWK